jgi:hypothetical protein
MNAPLMAPGTTDRPAAGGQRSARLPTLPTWLEAAGSSPAWYLLLPLVALVVVQPMFRAAFSAIDDHEVPMLLGPSGHLAWIDVPATIARYWNEPDRFRPFYWVVRVIETAVWSANATGWYLDRLGMLLLALGAAAALVRRYAPAPIAVLGAVLVVAGPQAENWFRLGSQEAIGTPVLLAGLALLVHGRTRPGLVLLVVAAVTKESFVPFAAAGCLIGWRSGDRAGSIVAAAVIAAAGAWVAYLHATAPDLYLQARTRRDMWDLALLWGETTATVALWPIAGAVALVRGWRPGILVAGVAGVLALTQVYLYAGVPEPHYLLPVSLLSAGATAFALACLAKRTPVIATVLAIAVAITAGHALLDQRSLAKASATGTVRWSAGLDALRQAMASDPGATVIVVPTIVWDEEAIVALRRFIPQGRAMIAPADLPAGTPEEVKLKGRLLDWSAHGWADTMAEWVSYVPYVPTADCILVAVSQAELPPTCPRTVLVVQP